MASILDFEEPKFLGLTVKRILSTKLQLVIVCVVNYFLGYGTSLLGLGVVLHDASPPISMKFIKFPLTTNSRN